MRSLYIKVPKKSGETSRQKLILLGIINKNLEIKPEDENLLIPVTGQPEGFGDIGTGEFEIIQKEASVIDELGYAPAYEQIGNIAVIDRYEKNAIRIADVLIRQKKIRTVLQTETSIEGEFRIRRFSTLAGEGKTETLYRENGCSYRLDLSRVYFTPRLATERMRIANQIREGNKVVDMFAGVGPFSILIAKKFPSAHVIAIDKNKDAIRYLDENITLNKVRNIEIREGDAREAVKGISDADHVIMNLPHTALEFLEAALGIIKKGGVIHFYAISHEDDLYNGLLARIENIANGLNIRIIPLGKRIVRPYAPHQHNICIDLGVFAYFIS
jgi:tRNA (guanine37-N1)-methyltransferase